MNILHLKNYYSVFLMSEPNIEANYLVIYNEEVKCEVERNLELLFSNASSNTLETKITTPPAPPTPPVSKVILIIFTLLYHYYTTTYLICVLHTILIKTNVLFI